MILKLKIVLFGLLAAMFILNTFPVHAYDFSGYVEAPYNTLWTRRFPFEKSHVRFIEDGMARRWLDHIYVDNIGSVPLTEAIMLVEVLQVVYDDEAGVRHTLTDPTEIAQLVYVENSEEMWQGNYVVWLGTIKPGHSKRFAINWWVKVLSDTFQGWSWDMSLWYLP